MLFYGEFLNYVWRKGRVQVTRNIDCLLEIAGTRAPLFWMLVCDEEPVRAYTQLMNGYRADPGLLARYLPH